MTQKIARNICIVGQTKTGHFQIHVIDRTVIDASFRESQIGNISEIKMSTVLIMYYSLKTKQDKTSSQSSNQILFSKQHMNAILEQNKVFIYFWQKIINSMYTTQC